MAALWLALSAAPEVKLPPKGEVVPVLTMSRPENAEAIRAGVKAARADLEKCDADTCFCAALKKVRFDVSLDGGTLTVSYPLQGHTGPSFTLDASGRVIDCHPLGNQGGVPRIEEGMRRWPIGVLLLTVACVGGAMAMRKRPFAAVPKDEARADRLRAQARVILITLDGPLRDDVLTGPHMPGLQQAVRAGGLAFPAEASSSMALSLPGYQAIAAGALTGCMNNECARIEQETMAERVARSLKLQPEQVAVFASWSRLARAVSSRDGLVFVDAPEDSPAGDGGPPWRNARFDAETFARAREHWQTHHPRFLHIAFLDTDEWAHQGLRPKYEQSLRETDARIVEVLGWVAALPREEAAVTTVVLVSDHGRGRHDWTKHGLLEPGSGEIFVAAIGPLVKRGEPGQVDQRDLRPTVERLFGLCPAQVEDDGRAIEAIIGNLPCR